MSDSTPQETQPDLPLTDTPAAAKKTAKKAAKKTAKKTAKKAAKKAAKKTAKKAAKKATRKTAATKESPQPPQQEEPKQTDAAPAKPEPTPAKTEPAPAKSEPVAEATPTPSASPPAPEDQPKIGRVKGLGRVKKPKNRDSAPQADAAPQQGNDESATPNKGRKQHQQGKQGQQGQNHQHGQQGQGKKKRTKNNRNNRNNRNNQGGREKRERKPIVFSSEPVEVNGMLELAPKGFGFLRVPEKNFIQCKKDVFVTPDFVRKYGLRAGVWIHGTSQEGPRGPQLTALSSINEIEPDEAFKLPHFEELKAVNPSRRIAFESTPDRFTTRVLDIVSPVGRGQRGLIVSPPRSGKTTLLLHMAEAIREKYDESIHLIVLLVDERPEEVTEFKRCLPGAEIYASSNDDGAKNHTRLSEMCIERAKRLVEGGKDVLILMDSITRLARAYNRGGGGGGGGGNKRGKNRGYQSGGIVAGALEMPRRLFAAARDTRNAGSLTILATALIQTNSRADEAIFQEFKGTGNMELVLDRRIAEQYIYPAVDIFKSGTRREELIMAEHLLHKIHLIRRGLSGHRPDEAMERLLFFLKKFPNNAQMLMEIKG